MLIIQFYQVEGGDIMKTKFMLIISILLLMVAIIILWKGNNNAIGTALLMIVMLLNVIRGLINLWSKRRLK
jgi:Zn-dependent protease with chaperone function